MDCFKGASSKFTRLEDVWDKQDKKLIIQIVEGKNFPQADFIGSQFADPYVKIFYGAAETKPKFKTEFISNTLNPKFSEKELFFMTTNGAEMRFEIWDKDMTFDDFMGIVKLGKVEEKIAPDTVVDGWYPLAPKKPDNKNQDLGQINIRFYYSTLKESRPLAEVFADNKNFDYEKHIPKLKTGDLIAFDSVGLVASLNKVTTNSPYGHLGMVVILPNKYTKKNEFYLVEYTNNNDYFLDAFKEVPGDGVCIFRLFERLHQYNCTRAWLCPLKTALTKEEEEKLVAYVRNHHTGKLAKSTNPRWVVPLFYSQTIDKIDKGLTKKGDFRSLFGADFIFDAFKEAGIQLAHDQPVIYRPNDLLHGDLCKFAAPIQIVSMKDPNAPEVKEEPKEEQPVLTEEQKVPPTTQQQPQYVQGYPGQQPGYMYMPGMMPGMMPATQMMVQPMGGGAPMLVSQPSVVMVPTQMMMQPQMVPVGQPSVMAVPQQQLAPPGPQVQVTQPTQIAVPQGDPRVSFPPQPAPPPNV